MIVAARCGSFVSFFKVSFRAITLDAMACSSYRRGRFIMYVLLTIFLILRYRCEAAGRQLARFIARVKDAIKDLSWSLFQDLMWPLTSEGSIFPFTSLVDAKVENRVGNDADGKP